MTCGAPPQSPQSRDAGRSTAGDSEPVGPCRFREVAGAVGLDFVHVNGMSGEYYFVEHVGGGGALFDYDGDGDLDVYVVQGHMLGDGKSLADYLFPPPHEPPFRDRLFRNDLVETGELHFTDVTVGSGIDARGYGMGAAVGDYDNDTCLDLYVTNWGANQLWRNRCDGTFEEVASRAGVADDRWSVSATWFHFDRDGLLDLYVTNYKDFSLARNPECRNPMQQLDYCGPIVFESVADRLYRNRGDGTFEDVSGRSGIAAQAGAGLGVVAADLDGDRWLDLYVANDEEPNFLWRNRRDGGLENVAALTGTAVDANGKPQASMGVDAADFDEDGDPDLVLAHLNREYNTLYRNLGDGLFADASVAAGLASPSWNHTGFGALFFDCDSDGWLDLFVANGAIQTLPELRRRGDPYPLHQTNQLFHNQDNGRFADVSQHAGVAFELSEVSRGAAFGDLDNDGDTDVVVVNSAGPVRLLRNETESRNTWLGLELTTGDPPRAAHGARVRIDLRGVPPRVRYVRIDGSYASANDPRVLVGLGRASEVTGVRVDWADGSREAFPPPPLRRYTRLQQGMGTAIPEDPT